MEDFVEDEYDEIDEEYEFDASQFFDFTKSELDWQLEEADRWFQVSGDHPHSPLVVKLNLDQIQPEEGVAKSASSNSDTDSRHGAPPSKNNAKAKPPQILSQLRSPKFMEYTASQLAKQSTVPDKQLCSHSRYQRVQVKADQKKCTVGSDDLGLKRQKLETGFLNKGPHSKHPLLKSSNKVTVPREPELETLLRSQRRRSNSSSSSRETQLPKHKVLQPSNSKDSIPILQTRSLPRPRKSKAQLTEFQEFHFKTSERASHHSSAKENRSSSDEKAMESSLTEEFNKLSLGPKSKRTSESERPSSANLTCAKIAAMGLMSHPVKLRERLVTEVDEKGNRRRARRKMKWRGKERELTQLKSSRSIMMLEKRSWPLEESVARDGLGDKVVCVDAIR